jgi:hypothetical protein
MSTLPRQTRRALPHQTQGTAMEDWAPPHLASTNAEVESGKGSSAKRRKQTPEQGESRRNRHSRHHYSDTTNLRHPRGLNVRRRLPTLVTYYVTSAGAHPVGERNGGGDQMRVVTECRAIRWYVMRSSPLRFPAVREHRGSLARSFGPRRPWKGGARLNSAPCRASPRAGTGGRLRASKR